MKVQKAAASYINLNSVGKSKKVSLTNMFRYLVLLFIVFKLASLSNRHLKALACDYELLGINQNRSANERTPARLAPSNICKCQTIR